MGVMGVVADNMKLGLYTVFFSGDESILAYTKGKSIYLNERIGEEIEVVNKHEVLHHYENSECFKKIKFQFLNSLSEDEIGQLRNEYMLKYYGLYSKEEVEKGIIDTEIAIDLIIGNSSIKFDPDDIVNNAYDKIISSSRINKIDKRYNSLKR